MFFNPPGGRAATGSSGVYSPSGQSDFGRLTGLRPGQSDFDRLVRQGSQSEFSKLLNTTASDRARQAAARVERLRKYTSRLLKHGGRYNKAASAYRYGREAGKALGALINGEGVHWGKNVPSGVYQDENGDYYIYPAGEFDVGDDGNWPVWPVASIPDFNAPGSVVPGVPRAQLRENNPNEQYKYGVLIVFAGESSTTWRYFPSLFLPPGWKTRTVDYKALGTTTTFRGGYRQHTGQKTQTMRGGPPGSPPTFITYGVRGRPPLGTREYKHGGKSNAYVWMKVIGDYIGDLYEWLDLLAEASNYEAFNNWMWERYPEWREMSEINRKFAFLFQEGGWRTIDFDSLVEGFAQNTIEDMVLGFLGEVNRGLAVRFGLTGYGFLFNPDRHGFGGGGRPSFGPNRPPVVHRGAGWSLS